MVIMEVPGILFDMETAFRQYAVTRDGKLIELYTLEQLKQVAPFLDDDMPHHKVILARIDELVAAKSHKRTSREKWTDRFIGAGFTILVGVILLLIKKIITGSW
jgi:hypothetical protein